ncbi:MAG: FecR domain-containing protein [Pseudomonadota bacterium]
MHNALKALLAGCLTAGFSLASSAIAQSSAEVGVNAAVRNEVNQTLAASGETSAAVVGGAVSMGDELSSGDASAVQVLLVDETSFTLGPNASLVIDEFVYDPSRDASEVVASAGRGAFRMFSGRTGRREAEVDTPTATIGIRGTFAEFAVGEPALAFARAQGLSMESLDAESTLVILRGPGRGNAGINKMGELDVSNDREGVILTKANTAVLVPARNAEIIGPFVIESGAQLELAMSYAGPVPSRSQDGFGTASLPPVRPPSDFMPPLGGVDGLRPSERPMSGCQFLIDGDPSIDRGQQGGPGSNIVLCQQVFQ